MIEMETNWIVIHNLCTNEENRRKKKKSMKMKDKTTCSKSSTKEPKPTRIECEHRHFRCIYSMKNVKSFDIVDFSMHYACDVPNNAFDRMS